MMRTAISPAAGAVCEFETVLDGCGWWPSRMSAAAGKDIMTIEGLSEHGAHPVQRAWEQVQVPQCGYCQSGQIMQAVALLKSKPKPTDHDIEEMMSGNICRCGTYQRIRQAIKIAAGETTEVKA